MGRIQYVDVPRSHRKELSSVTGNVTIPISSRDAMVEGDRSSRDAEMTALKKRIAELELALAGSKKGDASRAKAYRARKRVRPTPSVLGTE